MAKKKDTSNENLPTLAAAASATLSVLVLLGTFELVQNVKLGLQDAPNSYALWPAVILAIFAFVTAKDTKVKYVAVAVMAVLATSVLVWLFGVANF